ncbi:MAG: hypothetical protein IJZ74_04580 [Clostridia bacterium]|nr:hypothetical protein [Clostridia bacterium]
MRKQELPFVQARLDGLLGQPLTFVGYAADMLTMTFGPEGHEYHLHIQCSYRMATKEAILFDRIDYFEPSDAQCEKWRAEGLDELDFPDDWPDTERRLFEQVKLLCQRLNGMMVTEVAVNQLGDLTIRFATGETLLALPMSSGDHECWRFWNDALWPDQHMVVCGDHAELNGPGEQRRLICE